MVPTSTPALRAASIEFSEGLLPRLLDIGERQRITWQRFAVGRDLHGLAVGEHAHQLLVGHARPHPHAAGIHVDERRAGCRIKADAAARKPQADLAQMFEVNAGNVEIHGAAEHVLAESRHAGRAVAQHGVGLRRTIAAHYPDRRRVAGLALHLPHQVDQVRVHVGLLGLAPVAQEPVELFQRGLVVAAVALEGDGDVFVGMDVMQRDGAGVAFGDGVLQGSRAEQEAEEPRGRTNSRRAPQRIAQLSGAPYKTALAHPI